MSNNSISDAELIRELMTVLKDSKKKDNVMTVDEVLWLVLFIFIFLNKVYNYYFRRTSDKNTNSEAMKKDPSLCEIV